MDDDISLDEMIGFFRKTGMRVIVMDNECPCCAKQLTEGFCVDCGEQKEIEE